VKFKRDKLKAEVLGLLDEYEAMLVLLGLMDREAMASLVKQRSLVANADTGLLRRAFNVRTT